MVLEAIFQDESCWLEGNHLTKPSAAFMLDGGAQHAGALVLVPALGCGIDQLVQMSQLVDAYADDQ